MNFSAPVCGMTLTQFRRICGSRDFFLQIMQALLMGAAGGLQSPVVLD